VLNLPDEVENFYIISSGRVSELRSLLAFTGVMYHKNSGSPMGMLLHAWEGIRKAKLSAITESWPPAPLCTPSFDIFFAGDTGSGCRNALVIDRPDRMEYRGP